MQFPNLRVCFLIATCAIGFVPNSARAQTSNRSEAKALQQRVELLQKQLEQANKQLEDLQKAAQDAKKPDENRKPTMLRIYRLLNVSSEAVLQTVTTLGLGRSGRVATDPRTNSIIVQAPEDEHQVIEQILKQLDRVEEASSTIRTYQLARDRADMIQSIIRHSLATRNTALEYDDQLKALIVQGSPATHEKVTAMLKTLAPLQQKVAIPKSKQIRVVWLVSGVKTSQVLSEDLKPVVEELERLGVSGLKVAAQSIIRTMPDDPFETLAKTRLDSENDDVHKNCDLAIDGMLTASNKARISISATQVDGDSRRDLAHIKTTISAPLGHPVVLGVGPVEERTSAFVVTVDDGD